ncbi:MAG TPA: hypothetical protein VJL35_14790 [Gemmatimonadaceae bacterium]|nr:hypothetical protein [Gemmatimonadaceae bacterium]
MNEEALVASVDPGIAPVVRVLVEAGVETFESCQGGEGHCFADPTVRFHGERAEGFRALAVVQQLGFRVLALRRCWPILDGEPTGPSWELVFFPGLYVEPERRDGVLQAARTAGTAEQWFNRAR